MPASPSAATGADPTDRLRNFVRRLARPLDFASRDAYAHLTTVKNLGSFVSAQVVKALAEAVYSPQVEGELLALRQLFADFHAKLAPAEQKRRLEQARAILARLANVEVTGADVTHCTEKRNGHPEESPLSPGPSTSTRIELCALPIRFAKGVGPKRTMALERLGVNTVEDALWFLPWRYEDRSVVTPIRRLRPGQRVTVCGTVIAASLTRIPHRRLTVLNVTLADSTGRLHAVFFNQAYLEEVLVPGVRAMLLGRVQIGRKSWAGLQLDVEQYELLEKEGDVPLHVGRIVPIYHETKGWTSRHMRVLIKSLLDQYAAAMPDILPEPVRRRVNLPRMAEAIQEVHFPSPGTDPVALERGTTPARRRLAFEELFVLQLALGSRQRSVKEEIKGIRFDTGTPLLGRLRAALPFSLTPAQERVIADIKRDMASPRPMNRLIQGDVGCGKTVVALHALVMACGSGYQAALMAPTEILAEQHYLTLRGLLQELGLKPVLLKSGGRTKARIATLQAIASGEAQIVIGTHALIQKEVRFANLGLAVIDEQHKFGVLQRKTLLDKGYHPDVLVLTATPIPRTLAMTVYGDLDVSVIDTLPPGRKPVCTWLFTESQRRRAYRIVRDEIEAGRQAYIVYPLVEESEKIDLQAAIQGMERLQAGEFRDWRIGLLHGRLSTDEKERAMAAFKAGELHILVATTVIEVGVDVPNATVMVIEHAERFGLAQLHQLRGRVGRGGQQSYCLLITSGRSSAPSSEARRRLEALVQSNDGFVIAEEDLNIRGPGEFFGVRQWGTPEFRAASLIRDADLLQRARQEAFALLEQDPHLAKPEHHALRAAMLRRWQTKLELGSIS
ncbi:MAG TPA: ATP-dependent DNA helicase RecG [Nitrospiraceae bacterium]|jgi:ATP-dependent DNA helicase RecG|nr:ATP-dependent DNA helicase RecG [Nitrospiraceae bacterium]